MSKISLLHHIYQLVSKKNKQLYAIGTLIQMLSLDVRMELLVYLTCTAGHVHELSSVHCVCRILYVSFFLSLLNSDVESNLFNAAS